MSYDDVRRLVTYLGVPEGASDTVTTALLLIVFAAAVGTAAVAILQWSATAAKRTAGFRGWLMELRVFLPRAPERNFISALLRRKHKIIRITPAVTKEPAAQTFAASGMTIVVQQPPTMQPRLIAPTGATPVGVQHRGVAWNASRDNTEDFEIDGPFCPTHNARLLFHGFSRAARGARVHDRIGKLSVMRCPAEDVPFPLVSPHEEVTLFDIREELRSRLRALDEDGV